jgi:hypothetical protein
MNLKAFEELINDPLLLNDETLFEIEQLTKEYPFCQTLQLLYVKNLYVEKNIKYQQKLKFAAAIVGDRSRLKRYIEGVSADIAREVGRVVKERTHKVAEPIPSPAASSDLNMDVQEETATIVDAEVTIRETESLAVAETDYKADEKIEKTEEKIAEPVYIVRAKKVNSKKRYITSEYISSLLDDDTTREFSHADLFPDEAIQDHKTETVESSGQIIEKNEQTEMTVEKEAATDVIGNALKEEVLPTAIIESSASFAEETPFAVSEKPRLRTRGKEIHLADSQIIEKTEISASDDVDKEPKAKSHLRSREEKKKAIIETINKRFGQRVGDVEKSKEPVEKKPKTSSHRSIKSPLSNINIHQLKTHSPESNDDSDVYSGSDENNEEITDKNSIRKEGLALSEKKTSKPDVNIPDYFEREPPLSPLHVKQTDRAGAEKENRDSEGIVSSMLVTGSEIEMPKVKVETGNKSKPSPSELIDKFLKEAPRISRPKKAFYNPIDLASQASSENEDFYTETYARICNQQGDANKAIKIYNKLSLNFPEKSSYFAGLIEEIKKEHNI